MPGQLKVISTNEPATIHVQPESSSSGTASQEEKVAQPSSPCIDGVVGKEPPAARADAILEEQEDEDDEPPKAVDYPLPPPPPSALQKDNYTWRIDLHKTEPFWQGWFKGMSAKFLSLQCPKLLMLAGVDRLDKDLTVGQMQGKFQMNVISNVGHAVHEDSPEDVVEYVSAFLVRHKLVESKKNFLPVMPGC
jgi:protein phosphatase methylesterase 1